VDLFSAGFAAMCDLHILPATPEVCSFFQTFELMRGNTSLGATEIFSLEKDSPQGEQMKTFPAPSHNAR
jgi:hypothetical protein